MGYNTAIVICNDALNEIKKDVTFGKKLVSAIQDQYSEQKPLSFDHSATVVGQEHMDVHFTVLIGDNTGKIITSPANLLFGFKEICEIESKSGKPFVDPALRILLSHHLENLLKSNYNPRH